MSTPKDMHAELMRLAKNMMGASWAEGTPESYESERLALDAFARTLTDRITELEAQLEAVVAGGMGAMVPPKSAHVGDSNFESWFSEYSPAGRGTKQQMRDSYAAGMGDPAAQPAPAVVGPDDLQGAISKALRRAWQLGQTYWQQADSEYVSQHKKSAETQRKFEQLVDESRALITSPQPHQIAEPASQWLSIETAPKDGRTLLLGYFNSHKKWRTMRGQWMSEDYIAENWEEPDDGGPGWYETVVEHDNTPNCWLTEPKYWMPLPPAPKEPS